MEVFRKSGAPAVNLMQHHLILLAGLALYVLCYPSVNQNQLIIDNTMQPPVLAIWLFSYFTTWLLFYANNCIHLGLYAK